MTTLLSVTFPGSQQSCPSVFAPHGLPREGPFTCGASTEHSTPNRKEEAVMPTVPTPAFSVPARRLLMSAILRFGGSPPCAPDCFLLGVADLALCRGRNAVDPPGRHRGLLSTAWKGSRKTLPRRRLNLNNVYEEIKAVARRRLGRLHNIPVTTLWK